MAHESDAIEVFRGDRQVEGRLEERRDRVQRERVLLAWDASPQAMRAVTGALPLLKRAKKVQVTVFDGNIVIATLFDLAQPAPAALQRHSLS